MAYASGYDTGYAFPGYPEGFAGVYQAFVVDIDGSQFGELDNAKIGNIVWELNGPGSCDITLATIDSDATLLQPGREVQIWRDGSVIWWGPIVRPQLGLRESTWQCAGLLWYFHRRFMGKADRTNLLTNGGFEAGETGWTFTGVTHALDTGIKVEGAQSEKLTGGSADHATYASQTYTHTTASFPTGDALTLNAWVYVASAGYAGGAIGDRGLTVIHRRGGIIIGAATEKIDADTLKDQWQQFSVVVGGVQSGDTVQALLFPPHGVAYYDLVTLTLMESLSFGFPTPVDAADAIEGIVLYAQDNLGGFTHGKSDLNITTSVPDTGVFLTRVYQFVEHQNIGDALMEFVQLGIVDVDIAITSTTRVFTTYAKSDDARTPQFGKGSYEAGQALVLDTNVAEFSWSWDGEEATTSVITLGPGDNPGRPEGGAEDSGALGGLTLETIETAGEGVTVGELDTRAAAILRVRKQPEVVEVTTYPHGAAITGLVVGDTVPVDLRYGCCTVNATYRVVRISLDPHTDQATITLNPNV